MGNLVEHDELLRLLAALFDGRATDADRLRLDQLLHDDPAARTLYLRYAAMCAALDRRRAARSDTDGREEPFALAESSQGEQRLTAVRSFRKYVLAASLLIVAAVAVIVFSLKGPKPRDRAASGAIEHIATLTNLSDDVRFADADKSLNLGDELGARLVHLRSGKMQILFASTAVVDLTGPCTFQMIGPNEGRIVRGVIDAYVPTHAHGFTVNLPNGSRVVDLGTHFAVRVEGDSRSVVQVLEGTVRLDAPAASYTMKAGDAKEIFDGLAKPVTDVARLVVPPPAPPVDSVAFAGAIRKLGPTAFWTGQLSDDGLIRDAISGRIAHAVGPVATGGTHADPTFRFDGHSLLRIDNDPALSSPGNRLTLLAWVRLDNDEHQAIIHEWADGFGYTLEIYQHYPSFAVAVANDYDHVLGATSTVPMPTRRWVLLTGVYDGSTVSLYVDGKLAASKPVTEKDAPLNHSSGPIMIGGRSDNDEGRVHGAIDDVAIFRRALSPDEIAQLAHRSVDRGADSAAVPLPHPASASANH